MFQDSFEWRRPTLSPKAVELGERCLLHVQNYRPDDPSFMRQRTLEAIDAFTSSLRQEAARRD